MSPILSQLVAVRTDTSVGANRVVAAEGALVTRVQTFVDVLTFS